MADTKKEEDKKKKEEERKKIYTPYWQQENPNEHRLSDDTPEILQKRVLEVEHMILPKAVSLFCLDKLEVKGRIVYIKE